MLLEVKNLNSFYGPLQALWDVSLSVDKGEIITLIGSNGAGKSTFLKSIIGSIKHTTGEVSFNGKRIEKLKCNHIIAEGIVMCPEGRQVFPRLTVLENLRIGGYTVPKSYLEAGYTRAFDLFPVLKERQKQQAGTLSGGEQQMLAIGRALMSNPKILLLDEPSLGLSPILTEKIFDLIQVIRSQGVTILLVEQNAVMALEIADRGYVLRNGRIVASNAGAELLQSEEVISGYLGKKSGAVV